MERALPLYENPGLKFEQLFTIINKEMLIHILEEYNTVWYFFDSLKIELLGSFYFVMTALSFTKIALHNDRDILERWTKLIGLTTFNF